MNKKLLIFSLPCITSLVVAGGVDAAVRTQNQSRSYAGAYQQVMAMQQAAEYYDQQQPATTASATESLPVRVASNDLAERIIRGDTSAGVSMTNLENCARIYPSGNFLWDRPTGGHKITSPATCVAVVELRQYIDGINDIVLARANIASGDSINCNISDFPESTYTSSAYEITFPSDREPTIDDVVKVMNNEQKKNAGFKIAAGAVIGGIGGNLASSKSVDTGKKDATGTVVGVLTGGVIGAGSSYAGKVGGDMILSAGVNAAAGGVIGNMVASGNSVLRIEDCTDLNGARTQCLWGILQKETPLKKDEAGFYNISEGKTAVCKIVNGNYVNCEETTLIGLAFGTDYKSLEDGMADQNFLKIRNNTQKHYTFNRGGNDDTDKKNTMTLGYSGDAEGIWTPVSAGGRPAERVAAMIPDFKDKTFGTKMSDWYKWRSTYHAFASDKILGRDSRGRASELPKPADGSSNWTLYEFYPITVDAADGTIIDLNNKARLQSTMIGAGAGAGLGAFTAYQGAQDEIESRWASAVTEYKDSLQKFYCVTGTRTLSGYNDIAIIPNMSEY